MAHGVPAAVGMLVGTPLVQTSSVHGLLSFTGTHVVPPVPPVPPLLVAVLLEEDEAPLPPAPPALEDEDEAVPPPVPAELVEEVQPRALMLAISKNSKAEEVLTGGGREEL